MKQIFAELAHWDYDKLCKEMIALSEDSFDLDFTPVFTAFNETTFPINSPPTKAGKKPRKTARKAAMPAARPDR